jgi:hypothetical protein
MNHVHIFKFIPSTIFPAPILIFSLSLIFERKMNLAAEPSYTSNIKVQICAHADLGSNYIIA